MPKRDDQKSHKYSNFAKIETIQLSNIAEFKITFDDTEIKAAEPARATARIRLDRSQKGMVEFEVDLNEVPVYKDIQGKDVVVDWSFPGMDMGNQLFYSANGLQMVNKTLNHRDQFDI